VKPAYTINPQRLRRLLGRLLDIYSPSGKEEEVVQYVHQYLKRRGLPVIRQEVDERRENLIVRPEGMGVQLALIGHLDTVPAYELDDFGYEEDGDRIKGLGAADMKGGCAAMIEAFACLWEACKGRIPLMLALVVGEEEEGDGAEHLIEDFRFPWALIGEPTGLDPCLSVYGYVAVQLTAKGQRLHASLANRGRHAVEDLLKVLLSFLDFRDRQRPDLVYNIRDLFSSQTGFAVPEACEAWLDIHLPPETPLDRVTAEIEALVARERQARPDIDLTVEFDTVQSGYILPEEGPVVDALKGACLARDRVWRTSPFPSHSDANQLWAAGVKPIVLGPGQLESAHRPDESISFDEVRTAAEIYLEIGRRLIPG